MRRSGLDPSNEPAAVRSLMTEVLADYDERSLTGPLPPIVDGRAAAREVFDAVAGFGPLQRYLDDPTVEEVRITWPLSTNSRLGLAGEADRPPCDAAQRSLEGPFGRKAVRGRFPCTPPRWR